MANIEVLMKPFCSSRGVIDAADQSSCQGQRSVADDRCGAGSGQRAPELADLVSWRQTWEKGRGEYRFSNAFIKGFAFTTNRQTSNRYRNTTGAHTHTPP